MKSQESGKRVRQKEASHQRIIEVAARRFREGGLAGAGVQEIMEEAGLTHGGFYGHFGSKADLVAEALAAASEGQREIWLHGLEDAPERERLGRLVARYLSRGHRDAPGMGCPLPAISAEVARAPESVRHIYDDELRKLIECVEGVLAEEADEKAHARAVGALALCVGGLLLARAVEDGELSDDILDSCRRFAGETGMRETS